ncbi:MAG: hypothetical protein Q7L19_11245 [Pseudohongiella sp.]|nr:hypothetical protein [Pseudohongiella sp.]
MFKLFGAMVVMLVCTFTAAQQPAGMASVDTTAPDQFHAVLLPPLAGADATDLAERFAIHQARTGSLVLLADQSDDIFLQSPGNIPPHEIVYGNYAVLQKILQQRELLFWQIPLWTVCVNLMSALVLFLVSLKQSDLPLFRLLLAIALTGNFYFLPQLAPDSFPFMLVPPGIMIWVYLLYRLMQDTKRLQSDAPDRASQFLGYAVKLLLALFLVDCVFIALDLNLPNHPGMTPQLVPLGQLFGITAALYFLVSRHAETGLELENLNVSLDQRVKLASAELQERYAQLKQDALDTASMKERKNIYQSIHEDLGDKLLQLIYSATVPETADLARSALAELRDSRNLLPDQHRPLEDLLADARNEIQIRCDQAGLMLTWQQLYPEQTVLLSARQCSALSRTLREAISNLLKHAHAKSASVSIDILSDSVLVYRVQDDGSGMVSSTRPGRGLLNMQNRIRELGGSLTISAAKSGGTVLEFRFPLSTSEVRGTEVRGTEVRGTKTTQLSSAVSTMVTKEPS